MSLAGQEERVCVLKRLLTLDQFAVRGWLLGLVSFGVCMYVCMISAPDFKI